jgi:hypothetical protein
VLSASSSCVQKRQVGSEFAITITPRFGKAVSARVFHGHLFMDAEHTSNVSTTPALRRQVLDAGEGDPPPLSPRLPELISLRETRRLSEDFWLNWSGRRMFRFPDESAFQLGIMAYQGLLQRLTQIVQ